jgi:hypothetical protein
MAQVFALGCNVTRKGDVICDIKNPSRSVLLRISCDGHVEKLRLKNDTVILSPVACVIEGRLEPSDLFCRDPTSAHQLLGPLAFVFLSEPRFPIEVNSALSIAGMMAGTLSRELPNCTAELVSSQVPCTNITSDDPRLLLEGTASGAWSNWKCIMDQYGNECMKQMPEDGNVATMYGLTPCNAQDRYICTRGCSECLADQVRDYTVSAQVRHSAGRLHGQCRGLQIHQAFRSTDRIPVSPPSRRETRGLLAWAVRAVNGSWQCDLMGCACCSLCSAWHALCRSVSPEASKGEVA